MTEYARLVVAVDSTQAAKARAELEKLPGAAGRAESSANRMGASFAKLGGILASAISIREIARASEQYVNMTNRLRLVTEGSEQLAYAQEAVMRAAQQTYQPLETTAEVYQRIAQNANALGLSFAEVEAITKTVSRTIALSGADTQAAAGAMRQFGQALASGSLRGDELNSILEGTPALAQAVARGLGVTTGELRAMGAEGELTAAKIIAALQSQEAAVEEMSRTMNVTAGQAMVTFGNSLIGIVGKLDEASGASRGFASAVLDLSGALTRFSSGEFMDFFRDTKQTAAGFNNEISVTLSKIRDLNDARSRLDKNDPEDTVLFRFKFWNKEELDAEIAGLDAQVQRFQKARDRLIELGNKPGEDTPKGDAPGTPPLTPPPETTNKVTKAIDRQIESIRMQAETLGMTADQVELYKLAAEGATESQLRQAAAALQAVSAYEKQAEAIQLANDAEEQNNQKATSILESLRTEEEQIRESYERRRQIIIDATLLTEQQKNAALLALKQEHDEKMVQANGSYWERYMLAAKENLQSFDELSSAMLENFTGRFGDAFESMVFDSQSLGDAVSNLAEGMARSVVNALGQMAAQWVAYQALQLALGKANETAAIAGAVATGSSMAAAYAPAAAMASLASFGANSVPAMAAITSTTTLAQGMAMMSFDGGGFTGYGPRSGGLDGKGGFLAMMHPQETVIDHTKSSGKSGSGGGAGVVVNLIEDASKAGQVEQSSNDNGEQVLRVWVARIRAGGTAESQAIEQAFGLQRAGR